MQTFFFFFLIHTNVYSSSWLKTDKADSKRHLITAKTVAAPHLTAVNNYGDWLSFSPSLTGEGSHAANSQHLAVMRFVWFPLNVSHPMSFLIFNCFDGSSETTPFPLSLLFSYWYFSPNILRVVKGLFFFFYGFLRHTQNIYLIFNKQHPLSNKRFLFWASVVFIIGGYNSRKHTKAKFESMLERAT